MLITLRADNPAARYLILPASFGSVTVFRLAAVIQLVAGPEQSTCYKAEIHLLLHDVVAVPQGSGKHARFVILGSAK